MSDIVFVDKRREFQAGFDRLLEVALTESAITAEDKCVQEISGHGNPDNKAVDTGRLMGSITWRTELGGDSPRQPVKPNPEAGPDDGIRGVAGKGTAYVGTNVSYAQHVEFGTKRMRARPFLRCGMEAAKGDIIRIFIHRLGAKEVTG